MNGWRRIPMRLWVIGIVLAVAFAVSVVGIRSYYFANLGPVSNDTKTELISIPQGSSISQIGRLLYSKGLIRSPWAFEWYVHAQDLSSKLEAGTFSLSPSEPLAKIVATIASGHVAEGVVTILPGTTVTEIKNNFVKAGYSKQSVDQAFDPSLYADVPIIADKPASVSTLEGLLYPDSFDKISQTDPQTIVRESLNEMSAKITPQLQSAYAAEGLSVYQAITLASIVEQEVAKPSDRSQVAQVFISRLHQQMPLGSDVTALYGAAVSNQPPSLTYDSPWNTLLHPGLPPTPIGTVSINALNAVAHPAATNWLYFVTGDNGTTYFEQTLSQHQADTAQYCHKLCASP